MLGSVEATLTLAGNDYLFAAEDGFEDSIIGGRGTDFGEFDDEDEHQSVENLL